MRLPTLHVMYVPNFDEGRDAVVRDLQDQHPDVCLHEDPERRGLLLNYISVLRCSISNDSHAWSVVLSDDAVPLNGWKSHLAVALAYAPEDIVGLTHFGGYGQSLVRKGVPFGVGLNAMWGGAGAYRRAVLPGLLQLAELGSSAGWNPKGDDACVTAFNILRGGRTAMCSRAIFGQPHLRSTLGHGGNRRFPRSTIEDSGPWWGSMPRSAPLNLRVMPDVLELVELWRNQ